MKLTRRHLLLGAGAAAGFEPASRAAEAQAQPRIRLAVSTYSYWHFKPQKYPIESVIEAAAHLGFDGVEILHRQMAEEARPYLNKLKRLAFVHGLDLVMLSIHQDFVSPTRPSARKRSVTPNTASIWPRRSASLPSGSTRGGGAPSSRSTN